MIGSLNSLNFINNTMPVTSNNVTAALPTPVSNPIGLNVPSQISNGTGLPIYQTNIRTKLLPDEVNMYNEITKALHDYSINNQDNTEYSKMLSELLQNGKLLNNSSNDKTTTLKNLYDIIKTPRTENFDAGKILALTIATIYKPSTITQTFGDIPNDVKGLILSNPKTPNDVKQDPDKMDVKNLGSGTCPAASLEFHLANKRPAEFARWAQALTSPSKSVIQNINMKSLSKNYMDSIWFLNAFEAKTKHVDFDKATLELKPDDGAYVRANIQNNYYDKGERTILDVLFQSTIMQNASQQSYNSLNDIRAGKFNSNPQGLSSDEKTFIESIVDDKEKLSIVYQNIDDNQVLKGYRCDFNKIENHIKSAIDEGEDVIIGYVFTDNNNKITGGHEITIVDYKKDENGETIFVCNDTDDNNDELIEYKASYLLPKIHHAGYPAHLVEGEGELLNEA